MGLLYHPSFDSSRIYFGTDTRAFELLGGAALAMVWPSRLLRANIASGARRACDGLGVIGLVGIGALIWTTNEYSAFLYQGGFVLLTIATVLVIVAAVHPACRLGPALGILPLRWIGVRSYGIYLWHMPIIALTTPAGDHGVDLWRSTLQVAATILGGGALLALPRAADPPRRPRTGLAAVAQRRSPLARPAPPPARTRRLRPARRGGRTGRDRRGADRGEQRRRQLDRRAARDDTAAGAARPRRRPRPAGPQTASRTGNPGPELVPLRDRHRRLDLGRPHLARATSRTGQTGSRRSSTTSARPSSTTRSPARRSIVETYDGQSNAVTVVQAWKTRPLPWLLGARPRHERRRERVRRLERRPVHPDRGDDVRDRQPAGDVGRREVAPHHRAVLRAEHGGVERGAPPRLPGLPEHARVRLELGGSGRLVHRRRDPLHDAGVQGPRQADRRGAREGFPVGRATAPAAS